MVGRGRGGLPAIGPASAVSPHGHTSSWESAVRTSGLVDLSSSAVVAEHPAESLTMGEHGQLARPGPPPWARFRATQPSPVRPRPRVVV